jgi:hypothetical protein
LEVRCGCAGGATSRDARGFREMAQAMRTERVEWTCVVV